MRAVVCTEGELVVDEVPDLVPARGQILLDVLRCGICGSDLHARVHADRTADDAAEVGYSAFMRHDQRVVLGHEFVGRIAAYGPKTRRTWAVGTRVVAMPILEQPDGAHLTGLSAQASGGYAAQVLVSESVAFPVPDEVSDEHAALTEPLAVAWHAVRRSGVRKSDVSVVIGCGPIGLGIILMLKAAGVKRVVASDLSPRRRALAKACGADLVVDPREQSPWGVLPGRHLRTAPELLDLAFSTMKKLRRLPGGAWHHVLRTAEKAGATPHGPVVFECVGVPGIIEQIISEAPLLSRVTVVGVCMEPDTFRPVMAINKEIDLRFVLGYDPSEFHEALQMVASGKVDPTPLVTGTVGLDGVAGAFEALGNPEQHAKILIDPSA